MRVFVVGTAIAIVLVVIGIQVRQREPAVSNVLFGFAGVVGLMLVAAFYEWI